MSPTLGRYHFQAWTRRGHRGRLDNPTAGARSTPARAQRAGHHLQPTAPTARPSLPPSTVQLYGPGDVIGIDPAHVIRTEPRQFTVNFEPNYLCGIEFDAPDFPWLFTPAAPKGDRLRPWLVADRARRTASSRRRRQAPNPLPVIQVLVGGLAAGPVRIVELGARADQPATRLWPRRLRARRARSSRGCSARVASIRKPATRPSSSRRSTSASRPGLGQDASAAARRPSGLDRTHPAFPISLPYYYKFHFHTSDAGDFESLVRALTPVVLPATVGERPMDVSQPGPGVPSAGGPLGLDGALHSASTQDPGLGDPAKTQFQTALQTLINQPSRRRPTTRRIPNPNDPVIAPPIYGRWPAAIPRWTAPPPDG